MPGAEFSRSRWHSISAPQRPTYLPAVARAFPARVPTGGAAGPRASLAGGVLTNPRPQPLAPDVQVRGHRRARASTVGLALQRDWNLRNSLSGYKDWRPDSTSLWLSTGTILGPTPGVQTHGVSGFASFPGRAVQCISAPVRMMPTTGSLGRSSLEEDILMCHVGIGSNTAGFQLLGGHRFSNVCRVKR